MLSHTKSSNFTYMYNPHMLRKPDPKIWKTPAAKSWLIGQSNPDTIKHLKIENQYAIMQGYWKDNERKGENFECSDIVILEADDKYFDEYGKPVYQTNADGSIAKDEHNRKLPARKPIDDTELNEIVQRWISLGAFLIHESGSSKPGNYRIHALIKLDRAIDNYPTYEEIGRKIANQCNRADRGAVKGTQPLYGYNTRVLYYNPDNFISVEKALALPDVKSKPKQPAIQTGKELIARSNGNTRNLIDISRDIENALGLTEVPADDNGFIEQATQCLFAAHAHDDIRPAAFWNRESHILFCHKCDESYLAVDVAKQLGINTNKTIQRYELNDIGNKNRFVDKFGNDLMFVPEFDKWFIWNNVYWSEDEINQVQQMAESISIDLFTEAKSLNGHERTSHEKHALATGNKMRLNNMLDLAKQPFSVLSHQLDTNQMLFCVENAVIDLKTGKPIEATRNQNITKQAKVLFNENAECPKFLRYLTDAMNGDTEMVSFIQRLVGYTMTGYSNEKIMVLVTGPQNSGKTLLVQILGELFGIKRYAQSLGSESLMDFKRTGKDASPDMAKLRGARFVWCDESKADDVLNAGLVKKVTGGSTITARYLYQDEITFDPQFTLWFATNFTPKMATDDTALWSRIIPIHFDNVIPEEKQDKHLKQYIVDNELSGVLNWAIAGCLAYQTEGLTLPDYVKSFKQRLYEDQDSIGQFVDLLTAGDDKKLLRSECYAYYKKYCENNSIRPLGKSRFNQHLENNMKIPLVKTELGWHWNGVELSLQTRIDIDNGGE